MVLALSLMTLPSSILKAGKRTSSPHPAPVPRRCAAVRRASGISDGGARQLALGSAALRSPGRIDAGLYVTAGSLVALVGAFSDLGPTAIGVREISNPPAEGSLTYLDVMACGEQCELNH